MPQDILLSLLIGTVSLLTLWWLHLAYWSRRLSVQMRYTHEERIRLDDGGVIELRRIRSDSVPAAERPPVLLVHGIAVNHRNNDPFPERSFARFLSAQGRDVWLLTMRSGCAPWLVLKRPRSLFKAMRDHDLPRAVDEVLARTGAAQLDLGVYSMGGMVLYAALGRTLDPAKVHRTIVFASPGAVRPLGVLAWARILPRALTPRLPMRLLMRTIAFAHRYLPRITLHLFYNPKNCSEVLARCSMMNLFEDIPGTLGADFVRWAADGGRVTIDGAPVLEGLAEVRVPALFFAGSADLLAPVALVRAAYDAWGARAGAIDKRFVLLSRHFGAREDYGHGDFAFGTHAHHEVFVPALAFLEDTHASLVRDARPAPRTSGAFALPGAQASAVSSAVRRGMSA